jgi:pyruvate dehydrogenase E1 component alpha subunit
MTAGAGAAARARSLGIPADEVDGNFLPDIDAVARTAIEAVREGGGPRFLHAKTYRLTGHTAVDAAAYRPAVELAARQLEEPILRTVEMLRAAGETDLDADRLAAEAEMTAAYEAARAAPFPPADEAFREVQDVGAPAPGKT